jgi:hypothetical protein
MSHSGLGHCLKVDRWTRWLYLEGGYCSMQCTTGSMTIRKVSAQYYRIGIVITSCGARVGREYIVLQSVFVGAFISRVESILSSGGRS